jgi:hypothetical protein
VNITARAFVIWLLTRVKTASGCARFQRSTRLKETAMTMTVRIRSQYL